VQGLCLLSRRQLGDEIAEIQLVSVTEAFSGMVVSEFEEDAWSSGLLPEGQVVGKEMLLEKFRATRLESGEPSPFR
jgi:hypothetical protein